MIPRIEAVHDIQQASKHVILRIMRRGTEWAEAEGVERG